MTRESPAPLTPRQGVPNKYIDRSKLQGLLERLFPDQPGMDFQIRLDDDVWSFVAPQIVPESEFEAIAARS